jgi:hypothetical protein
MWVTPGASTARTCLPVLLLLGAAALAFLAGPAHAATGDEDPSFSGDGKTRTDVAGGLAEANVVQADGKIVVVGSTSDGGRDFALVRYKPNGGCLHAVTIYA